MGHFGVRESIPPVDEWKVRAVLQHGARTQSGSPVRFPASRPSAEASLGTSHERIPLWRPQLRDVRGGFQSREGHQLRELTGCSCRGIHPDDLCVDRRGWLLLEKLRQAGAEALEDRGFDSVALGAGLRDLEDAVPELQHPYESVGGIDNPVLPDSAGCVQVALLPPVPSCRRGQALPGCWRVC